MILVKKKYQNIVRIIWKIVLIVSIVYSLISIKSSGLFVILSSEFLFKFEIVSYCAIGLLILTTILQVKSFYFPKSSLKRRYYDFIKSILNSIEVSILITVGVIRIDSETGSFIYIDFTYVLLIFAVVQFLITAINGYKLVDICKQKNLEKKLLYINNKKLIINGNYKLIEKKTK